MQVLGDDCQRPIPLKRQATGDQFVEHDPQSIQVGAPIHRLAQGLLGGQVKDRAGKLPLSAIPAASRQCKRPYLRGGSGQPPGAPGRNPSSGRGHPR